MKYIKYAVTERMAFITLNRPEKSNALCYELVAELKEALDNAEGNDEVKIVILRANGNAFCAGADLDYLQTLQTFSYEQNLADSNHLMELYLKIYQLKKVVISQVHAPALAGGCGLATVCDFCFASTEANFGYTEVKIGFVPAIVMVFLVRKVGETRAKQLLLGGAIFPAQEALAMGLINFVTEGDKLADRVLEFANQLIENNSAYSMSITKQMIGKVQSLNLLEALTFASEMNAKARASDDCKKGIAAFINKEKLIW